MLQAYPLPVVLWFDDYDEVFTGHALRAGTHPLSAVDLDVLNTAGDVRCVGSARATLVPPLADPPRRCDGMAGILNLSCSDGRRIGVEWSSEEACNSGHGAGRDGDDHALRLVYGGSEATAQVTAEEAHASLAGKPGLPPVASPGSSQTSDSDINTATAFFVSWQGHLVTNHHTLAGAGSVQVQLDDGEILDATVLHSDPEHDLALLHVDAIRTPLPLQRRIRAQRGEEVFTLGYPLIQLQGQEQKATFGRINSLSGLQGDVRFIQMDVPIQPGNSGGPLLNRGGEVLGVVTSMLHQQTTYEMTGVIPQNVNYAVKSDFAWKLVDDNVESWAGHGGEPVEQELSDLIARTTDSVVLILAW
ncbi:MAG: trypsin-like peptidase domain-containing protein [Deltaproteobacteria bacterium]|nr:trypsin-like peptidase domain-containing protein [Deltaproteobacteria bacterium]MBW2419302.1 trypsin-like peptidase domain-containing protein [Deltaproteobacteria bacterium]